MHDQPEPTEEEQEQVPERLPEEDAMRYPGHEDPESAREPKDDAEIHDAS
jgi:hypothetical protein